MIAVKRGGIHLRQALFRCIIKIVKTQSEDWPERIKEGWVIPLHKKSAKNDLNNYRGVCLLPFASRIILRILASRLRELSEKIEVLGETQSGFRQNRSTADATQINIRVDEENRRVLGYEPKSTRDRPGAVLLDITTAYPRANKPLMWEILDRLAIPNWILRLLKGLHEDTTSKIKGRNELSEGWKPQRGLREGCATSPTLFNIYHSQVVRLAKALREEAAK